MVQNYVDISLTILGSEFINCSCMVSTRGPNKSLQEKNSSDINTQTAIAESFLHFTQRIPSHAPYRSFNCTRNFRINHRRNNTNHKTTIKSHHKQFFKNKPQPYHYKCYFVLQMAIMHITPLLTRRISSQKNPPTFKKNI